MSVFPSVKQRLAEVRPARLLLLLAVGALLVPGRTQDVTDLRYGVRFGEPRGQPRPLICWGNCTSIWDLEKREFIHALPLLCDLKSKCSGDDTKTQAAASVLQCGSCSQVWRGCLEVSSKEITPAHT
ncbi:hypothetical protein AV530_003670 [Patagioenas fasciata monilis]|uniref:Uncharacterized protein n=1 Tax=Patagioenas fasciata monilis TaxID=372326 RepID=A0A1V4KY79_PATFA|nr:hypothetical protein AV530_003670 [Patagioenas fasciata monilis]